MDVLNKLLILLFAWKTRHVKPHPSRDYAYRFVDECMPSGGYKFWFYNDGRWEARRL